MTGIDLSRVTAIDVHTHVHRSVDAPPPEGSTADDMGAYSASARCPSTPSRSSPSTTASGTWPASSSAWTASRRPARSRCPPTRRSPKLAADNSDVAHPVRQHRPAPAGRPGCAHARRLITDHGVRGFKFHPTIQGFYPNDRVAYPLYEVIAGARADRAVPHRPDRGRRGRPGRRRDPPEVLQPDGRRRRGRRLPGHGRSSWPTRRSPGRTRRWRSPPTSRGCTSTCPAGRRSTSRRSSSSTRTRCCSDKVLFGSDFPVITPERWMTDFAAIAHQGRGPAQDHEGQRRAAAGALPRSGRGSRALMQDVEGKVAFITGGSSGIGRGIALAFARAGMQVVISGRRQEFIDESLAEFAAAGLTADSMRLDITDAAAVDAAAEETVRRHGRVDVLVNNAGIGLTGPVMGATARDWDWLIDVNIRGVGNGIRSLRAAHPGTRRGRPRGEHRVDGRADADRGRAVQHDQGRGHRAVGGTGHRTGARGHRRLGVLPRAGAQQHRRRRRRQARGVRGERLRPAAAGVPRARQAPAVHELRRGR